jgi:hypothetical protein
VAVERTKPQRRNRRSAARAVAKPRKTGGTLKEKILAALKAAGKDGLSVGDIAEQIHGNKNSINNWLYTAGKKIREIQKVGRGRFGLRG